MEKQSSEHKGADSTEVLELRREVEELRRTLAERPIIERAKWLLVERRRISEPEAQRVLQRTAMDRRMRIVEVAQEIIDAADLLSGS